MRMSVRFRRGCSSGSRLTCSFPNESSEAYRTETLSFPILTATCPESALLVLNPARS